MRRKLNVRFLIGTVVLLAAIAIVTAVVREVQVRRNAGMLLRHAEQAWERKDFGKAAVYLQRYLAYEPDDTDALIRYAHAVDRAAGDSSGRYDALLLLETALRRRPNARALRADAVRLALEGEFFAEAAHHLQILLAASPNDARLWHDLGRCQENLDQFEQAAASYRKAIQLDPKDLIAVARLGRLLRDRLDRPAELTELLDATVQANPDSAQALLLRARHLETSGWPEAALRDLERAHALAPKEIDVALWRARLLEAKGDLSAARAALVRAAEDHPGDARPYRALAVLEQRDRKPAEAVRWLRQAAERNPNNVALQVALAELVIDAGDAVQAQALLERLRQEGAIEAAECLQARLWLQQGKPAEAVAALKGKLPRLLKVPDWGPYALLVLGRGHALLGDVDQALASYRQAVAKAPDSSAARLALAAALLDAGRTAEAVRQLERLRDDGAALPQASLLLARALLRQTLAQPEIARRWAPVEQAVRRAAAYNGAAPEVALLEAEVWAAQEQFDRARDALEQAQNKTPSAEIAAALADLARRRGDIAEAWRLLTRAEREFGAALPLRRSWMRYYAAQDDRQARAGLHAVEQGLFDLPAAEQMQLRRELADLWRRRDAAEAARIWRAVAAANPADLHSRLALFDLALEQRDRKAADDAIDELRRREGDAGVLWRYARIARLLTFATPKERSPVEEAGKLLAEIQRLRPDWGKAALAAGWIADHAGNEDAAVAHYLRAVQANEMPPALVARLVRLLYDRGRLADADEVLRRFEEQGPVPREFAQLAAEIALSQRSTDRAAALARQAIPDPGRDYRDARWLAHVLDRAGRSIEAESALRAAVERSPAEPETWAALVEHLAKRGQKAEAAQVIAEAGEKLPKGRALSGVARCHEALGDLRRAEELFRQGAAAKAVTGWRDLADFYLRHGRYADAELWLRKLVDPNGGAPRDAAEQARCDLAVALARQGDDAKFQEALALVPKTSGASRAELLARGLVLATRPAHRDEAAALLESAERQKPLAAADAFVLVKLYQQGGRHDRAAATLAKLLTSDDEKPEYLAAAVRSLLAQGKAAAAREHLARLRQIAPNHPELTSLHTLLEDSPHPIAKQQ